MNIGIDFDNVLVKSNKLKAAYAQIMFNRHIPSEIFRRNFVTNPDLDWLTEEQYQQIQNKMYKEATSETVRFLEPVSGVITFVSQIMSSGHILSCITSHEGLGLEIAQKWLKRHGLRGIECIGVGYGKEKTEAARELKLDVFLDDDYRKLVPLSGIVKYLYLFSWDYNQNVQIDLTVITGRVCSWEDFYERVKNLSKT